MNDLPEALTGLHDATLASVEFDWRERRCTFLFQGGPGEGLQHDFSIVFNDVIKLTIPSERPWGPSLSLLEVDSVDTGRYVLVMQSGDEIWISAGQEPIRVLGNE
jgi:hypothetical protein